MCKNIYVWGGGGSHQRAIRSCSDDAPRGRVRRRSDDIYIYAYINKYMYIYNIYLCTSVPSERVVTMHPEAGSVDAAIASGGT